MTKAEFTLFLNTIDKDSFEYFYRTHSNKVVLEKYNIKYHDLKKILDILSIPLKTKEEKNIIISNTLLSKSQEEKDSSTKKRLHTRSCWTEEYKNYITEKMSHSRRNKTEEEKQKIIDKFKASINSKSEEEKEKTRQKKSISAKKYFSNLSEDKKLAFSEKMKEVYANLPEDVKQKRKEKISATYRNNCIKKYGVSNTFKLQEIQAKQRKTIKERYGVDYACQLPQCRLSGNDSSINIKFKTLLEKSDLYLNDTNREFNIGSYSYDFKLNDILIELNPTATHNSTWSPFKNQEKSKTYHYNKSKLARDNGYRCLCVWDWDDKDKIIDLLKPRDSIYARKCKIRELNLNITREYLNQYHLQGYVKSSIRLGLFYNDLLVSVMTFGKPRYNRNYEWELLRYCSSYKVIGGAEKLFSYFIKNYNPFSIISYCDLSKFTGNLYTKLGFRFKNYSIGKHWYNSKLDKHITDNLLRQRGFDQLLGDIFGKYGKGTSNEELMKQHGFVEIYDCGQASYEWWK